MRQVIDGNGKSSNSAVLAWLQSRTNPLFIAHLYLIGDYDDPRALRLTDWQSPLYYNLYGLFTPAVIERGAVKTSIGLEVQTLDLNWHPEQQEYTTNIATAGPYQLASNGFYKDCPVRIWKCYMPTPGDANTYGCSELFGGRIGPSSSGRGVINFNVNSFLDAINQKVPSSTITITNTLANTFGATPPVGMSSVPYFNIIAGSTTTTLICDCITSAHHIFADDALVNGFLVFNRAIGMTLGGQWSTIESNKKVTVNVLGVNTDYNQLQLFKRLPFAPTPGVDTMYVSGKAPINLADGSYYGFPYVPDPETAA